MITEFSSSDTQLGYISNLLISCEVPTMHYPGTTWTSWEGRLLWKSQSGEKIVLNQKICSSSSIWWSDVNGSNTYSLNDCGWDFSNTFLGVHYGNCEFSCKLLLAPFLFLEWHSFSSLNNICWVQLGSILTVCTILLILYETEYENSVLFTAPIQRETGNHFSTKHFQTCCFRDCLSTIVMKNHVNWQLSNNYYPHGMKRLHISL